MSDTPYVDVLMPTYKPTREHLREALESLLKQTFQDWQCFIHDEPTDTNTEEMIHNELSDPRITYQRSNQRLGIGKNWNATFQKTSAPIVAYLFQDDYWDPDYLKRAVKILEENPTVGIISMNHEYKLEGSDSFEEKYYENLIKIKNEKLKTGFHDGKTFLTDWMRDSLWPNLIGEPCFVVMRREVMEKAGGFHEEMQQQLDIEYWVKMLLIGDLYYEKENCGFFRVHSEAASARNRREGKGAFDRIKILEWLISTLPDGELKDLTKQAKQKQMKRLIKRTAAFSLRHPLEMTKMVVRKYMK